MRENLRENFEISTLFLPQSTAPKTDPEKKIHGHKIHVTKKSTGKKST